MRNGHPIMVVDDDRIDLMTVKRAIRDLKVTNPLITATDGETALDMLRVIPERPCLILLDINMPRMNGLELLGELKGDPSLRSIPVVMLTTSKEDSDKLSSFDLSVAGYMIKPVDYAQFVDLMRALHLYWTLSEPAAA